MDESRVRELVRRVVARAISEPDGRGQPGGGVEVQGRPGGVCVEADPGGQRLRPDRARPGGGAARDSHGMLLVAAEDLAGVADGGTLDLPAGARLTPLASEEAWRRGIVLRSAGGRGRPGLRVALGADHGGFSAKERVKAWLVELGHQPIDLGTHDESAVDYPDFARAVAEAVAGGRADLGVCVDGAGIGSAMAANKVPGVRAAMCYDEKTARNAREHNFANVLSLGGKLLDEATCRAVVREFLATPEGAARHARRVEKISSIETQYTNRRAPLRRVLPEDGAAPAEGRP